MIKAIQAITLTQIAWSIAVLIPVYLLFRYWIRKKNLDMKKLKEKEHIDWLLDLDESEMYMNDDREVEYYMK